MSDTTTLQGLKRWLSRRAPKAAVTLQVSRGDTVVGVYDLADTEARAELAEEILTCCEGDAEAQGVACRYSLRWCTDAGAPCSSVHSFRCGTGTIMSLDGSQASLVSQAQRHVEAMARQTAQTVDQLLRQSVHMSGLAIERATAAERRVAILEADNAALRAQLREHEGQTSQTEPSVTEQAIVRIGEALVAQHMGGAGGMPQG